MINSILTVTAVAIRVLFLVLFCGAYIWFAFIFSSATSSLPPPQRLQLFNTIQKRFMIFNWILVVLMSVGGFGTLLLLAPSTLSNISTIGSTGRGVVTVLEGVFTLGIIVCSALLQLMFRRMSGVSVSFIESDDKLLKWYTVTKTKQGVSYISSIYALAILNLILGTVALVLGVLFSSL